MAQPPAADTADLEFYAFFLFVCFKNSQNENLKLSTLLLHGKILEKV